MANIYQRAIDIFNKHVEPDISQGGGGGSTMYCHNISITGRSTRSTIYDSKTCGQYLTILFTIVNDSETPLNSVASVLSALDAYKGYSLQVSGRNQLSTGESEDPVEVGIVLYGKVSKQGAFSVDYKLPANATASSIGISTTDFNNPIVKDLVIAI